MSNKNRKLVAIVYTDIVGFSNLSANDEKQAIELVNTQKKLVQKIVKTHNGTIHKELGDGFLLTFQTVTSAVEFGIDFQRSAKQIDGLNVRIGIHSGEITTQNNDVFGDDINIGARIEPHSPIGGIAISEKVQMELSSLPEYSTQLIGTPKLKGIKQTIKIYCISSHGLNFPKTFKNNLDSTKMPSFKLGVLNITGIIFTLIGALFWIWYAFGEISYADTSNKKIFQSIAVLYLENLSNDREDENISAALTQGIITAFSKLQLFDVKARSDVVKFKNKVYDHNEVKQKLGVDVYFDGSITRLPNTDELVTNIALVDAHRGNNIWAGEFKKKPGEILKIPNFIISEVSNILGINNLSDLTTLQEKPNKQDQKSFSLLGKAMHLLDGGNYIGAFETFSGFCDIDSVQSNILMFCKFLLL